MRHLKVRAQGTYTYSGHQIVRLLGRQLGDQVVLESLPPQPLLTTSTLCHYSDSMPLSSSRFSTALLLPADFHGS